LFLKTILLNKGALDSGKKKKKLINKFLLAFSSTFSIVICINLILIVVYNIHFFLSNNIYFFRMYTIAGDKYRIYACDQGICFPVISGSSYVVANIIATKGLHGR
jgi:hypothetical protein